jgi:chemotaxis regulatin CheY-phosphate phosphatase CheZ
MYSHEKRRRFIQLRGQGLSYRKIAKELNLSTNTLTRWSLILDVHINNARIIEFEGLMEEYFITCQQRTKALATQLNNITQALVECDFTNERPHRLIEMQTRITKELKEITPKIEFHRKIPFGGNEAIRKILNHTDTWPVGL